MERNGKPDSGSAQRALHALDLMRTGVTVDEARAQAHTGGRAIEKVRGVLARDPSLETALRNGSLSLNAACQQVGYKVKSREVRLGVAFGKGDKWAQATETIVRYLQARRSQGWFRDVNPAQAQRRLQRLDEIQELLDEARKDLEPRAVRAQTSLRTG